MRIQRMACFIIFALSIAAAAGRDTVAASPIKLATLAPKGTSLHQVLLVMGEKWRKASNGAVTLHIYPDGTMGGEAAVVQRMRVGEIQAAMLTVTGLSKIDPSITAIEDMPMMFRSLDEVAFVREKMRGTLERKLREKGYVLLFWGDAGWVRFFTKTQVTRPSELKQTKLFAWAGSEDQIELMKSAGFRPIPLETANIYPSLKTDMINAVPTIPIAALAGQFYGPCPHMLELNWAPLIGGTVIKAQVWDSLPADIRTEMLKAAEEAGEQVTARSRKESDEAVEAMKKRGLIVHAVSAELDAEWRNFAEGLYPKIRGGMVPADMFDEVQRLLKERRAASGAQK
ncbi:MAG: TRAP transporter substrate-binding protein DctP [Acidobacteria bacterium]|nr:TRAP transporter substrate-binding protein DctP [Acidobacteriota bacterium]